MAPINYNYKIKIKTENKMGICYGSQQEMTEHEESLQLIESKSAASAGPSNSHLSAKTFYFTHSN